MNTSSKKSIKFDSKNQSKIYFPQNISQEEILLSDKTRTNKRSFDFGDEFISDTENQENQSLLGLNDGNDGNLEDPSFNRYGMFHDPTDSNHNQNYPSKQNSVFFVKEEIEDSNTMNRNLQDEIYPAPDQLNFDNLGAGIKLKREEDKSFRNSFIGGGFSYYVPNHRKGSFKSTSSYGDVFSEEENRRIQEYK